MTRIIISMGEADRMNFREMERGRPVRFLWCCPDCHKAVTRKWRLARLRADVVNAARARAGVRR